MELRLFNTLKKRKEIFKPLKDRQVGLYTCGPTVYNFAHIGNLRTFIFEDILRRVLEYNGYRVKHIMNITDVGHLTGDQDMGEDKIAKSAKEKRITAWQVADFYTQAFLSDLKDLNILKPHKMPKASQYIKDQIKLVKILETKGYTYQTSDGVYFNTAKLKDYGKLAKLNLSGLLAGARVEKNPEKKNPTDFALWKFAKPGEKREMAWPSPWGDNSFPGWHIECSVLSTKFLGQPFDIHTGGVDHIPIHHTNEIAQSETAFNKPLAKYWLHGEFLVINKQRMGKSEGNFITLQDIKTKGYQPLAYRYFVLNTHYRSKLNFSWLALQGAENALNNLYQEFANLPKRGGSGNSAFEKKFLVAINDDLNMPKALSVVWQLLRSKTKPASKAKSLLKFDKVLGLNLNQVKKEKLTVPVKVQKLVKLREEARKDKNFRLADKFREEIKKAGFLIEDTAQGSRLKKIKIN